MAVNPMNLGDGGGGGIQTHRTNILAPFLSEGFGHKKDSAWYVRTARLLAIWEDNNKNLAYNLEVVFNTTVNTVYTHLINDRKWSEADATTYLDKFSRDYRRLYYGPGTAYIIQQRKRGPFDILHSNVGWLELIPMGGGPFIDVEDDFQHLRVKTQNFKMEIIRCPYFKTERCDMCTSGFFQEYAPSEKVLRKCKNCKKHVKSAQSIPTSAAAEAPKGVRAELQQRLVLNTRKQLEQLRGIWEKHLTDHLSVPGHLKAPDWDCLYGGKYISETDSDPNKDWEKKIPMDNPNVEWMSDPKFAGDYPAYLKSKGKTLDPKVNLEPASPTFPVEDGDVPVQTEPQDDSSEPVEPTGGG